VGAAAPERNQFITDLQMATIRGPLRPQSTP